MDDNAGCCGSVVFVVLFRVIGSFAGVRSHFRDFQSEFVTHIEKQGLMSCLFLSSHEGSLNYLVSHLESRPSR
jgi:hypothetical protein